MSDIATDFRSLRRPRDTRLLGGLCSAISGRLGVDVLIIRVLAVLAMAFTSAMPLVYLLGLMLVPAAPEVLGSNGTFVRTARRRRQLVAYLFFLGAADAVLDNKMPTNKVFAVALIVGGLLLMQFRNRALNSQSSSQSPSASHPTEGGWTATPAGAMPPRWGLAGEVANPELWNPQPAVGPGKPARQSVWHTQFGNLALVTLVGVLAIGLWSNTSERSPVRRAAIREQLDAGPVVIQNLTEFRQLKNMKLGDGSFVIDLSSLALDDDEDLELFMGAGRLELITPDGVDVLGTVDTESSSNSVSVRSFGTKSFAPADLSSIDSATREDPLPTLTLDISADAGLVCVRGGARGARGNEVGNTTSCDQSEISRVPTSAVVVPTPPSVPSRPSVPSPPSSPSN
jgi:phage shock protein PspC (stress-responsive transcriptional regulator)